MATKKLKPISIREYRPGNIVCRKGTGEIGYVRGVGYAISTGKPVILFYSAHNGYAAKLPEKEVLPVPLTIRAIRAGVFTQKQKLGKPYTYEREPFRIRQNTDLKWEIAVNNGDFLPFSGYAHDLQNLFAILTDREFLVSLSFLVQEGMSLK